MSRPKSVQHTIRISFDIDLTHGNRVPRCDATWLKGEHPFITCTLKADYKGSWWEAVGKTLFQLAEARDSFLINEQLLPEDQGETTLTYSADAGAQLA